MHASHLPRWLKPSVGAHLLSGLRSGSLLARLQLDAIACSALTLAKISRVRVRNMMTPKDGRIPSFWVNALSLYFAMHYYSSHLNGAGRFGMAPERNRQIDDQRQRLSLPG